MSAEVTQVKWEVIVKIVGAALGFALTVWLEHWEKDDTAKLIILGNEMKLFAFAGRKPWSFLIQFGVLAVVDIVAEHLIERFCLRGEKTKKKGEN